jgi:hypothetical protein
MRRAIVACDLCELRTDVTWVMRTDHFTVLVGDEPHFYRDGEEWGLCGPCKHDVLADEQEPILARRRLALVRDFGGPGWDGLGADEQAAIFQVTDLVVMTALACRQKAYGRAWTASDEREALEQLREDGGRGLRH